MNKKFTFLLIPDDESGTKSYRLSKNLLRFIFIFIFIILIGLIVLIIKSVPSINKYDMLNEKYNELAQERMKVIELAEGLKRIKQMNEFVRNSLGAEFNFSSDVLTLDRHADRPGQETILLIRNRRPSSWKQSLCACPRATGQLNEPFDLEAVCRSTSSSRRRQGSSVG